MKSKMGKSRIGLVVFFSSLSVIVNSCSPLPNAFQAGKAYIYHLERGELDAAVKMHSKRIINQAGIDSLRSELSERPSIIKSAGGVKSLTAESETVTGEVAEVIIKIEYGDGEIYRQFYRFIQEEGSWKIDFSKQLE